MRFRSEITLPSTLACDTNVLPGHQSTSECSIDTVSVVDIFDPIGNRTVFYEYVRPPCVELTYFAGTVVKAASWLTPNGMPMCADRSVEAAAAGCCAPGHGSSAAGKMDGAYVTEVMRYDPALARGAARTDGLPAVCGDRAQVNSCFGTGPEAMPSAPGSTRVSGRVGCRPRSSRTVLSHSSIRAPPMRSLPRIAATSSACAGLPMAPSLQATVRLADAAARRRAMRRACATRP